MGGANSETTATRAKARAAKKEIPKGGPAMTIDLDALSRVQQARLFANLLARLIAPPATAAG